MAAAAAPVVVAQQNLRAAVTRGLLQSDFRRQASSCVPAGLAAAVDVKCQLKRELLFAGFVGRHERRHFPSRRSAL